MLEGSGREMFGFHNLLSENFAILLFSWLYPECWALFCSVNTNIFYDSFKVNSCSLQPWKKPPCYVLFISPPVICLSKLSPEAVNKYSSTHKLIPCFGYLSETGKQEGYWASGNRNTWLLLSSQWAVTCFIGLWVTRNWCFSCLTKKARSAIVQHLNEFVPSLVSWTVFVSTALIKNLNEYFRFLFLHLWQEEGSTQHVFPAVLLYVLTLTNYWGKNVYCGIVILEYWRPPPYKTHRERHIYETDEPQMPLFMCFFICSAIIPHPHPNTDQESTPQGQIQGDLYVTKRKRCWEIGQIFTESVVVVRLSHLNKKQEDWFSDIEGKSILRPINNRYLSKDF